MTKRGLADAISVTPRTVYNYCAYRRSPDENAIRELAAALRFPVDFFFESDFDAISPKTTSFRALSRATARQREMAIAVGELGIMVADWIDAHFNLPEPNLPRYDADSPETASMAVREFWSLGELSIRDMLALLEQHGVRIFALGGDMSEISAFSFWRGRTPFVFLNTSKSAERTRMDAAHELGHLVLHDGNSTSSRQAENEANDFASAFLVPQGSVKANGPFTSVGIPELIQMKRRWNVSLTGLIVRLKRLNMISRHRYTSLIIEASRRRFRTNEPNSSRAETSQILNAVFNPQRSRVDSTTVAEALKIPVEDVHVLLQGLVPFPVPIASH